MELEKLKDILSKLQNGDIGKIATSTKRSKNAVYQVFRKESFVAHVIETALDIIEANAVESLRFVKEKRAELKKSADEYEAKKQRQLEKRMRAEKTNGQQQAA